MQRIYLDNAASTPLDPEVFEYMVPILRDLHGNPSSVHAHGRSQRALIEQSRKDIAACIGAAPAEIFFTSGGTEADNMAIWGSVRGLGVKHIITTRIEHHAVTHPVEHLEREGIKVTWLPVDRFGHPELDALEQSLRSEPNALVSLMHANNELGTILDLASVSAICKKHGAYLHSDTVQSMAHIQYNLSEMDVHFVTASAHKFYGPKGIGGLFVRRRERPIRLIAQIEGGGHQKGLRSGTLPVPLIVGMARALAISIESQPQELKHLQELRNLLEQLVLQNLEGVTVNGSPEHRLPNTSSLTFDGVAGEALMLAMKDVAVSSGSACSAADPEPSHVLRAIGLTDDMARSTLRFSLGRFNTPDEVEFAAGRVVETVKNLRNLRNLV